MLHDQYENIFILFISRNCDKISRIIIHKMFTSCLDVRYLAVEKYLFKLRWQCKTALCLYCSVLAKLTTNFYFGFGIVEVGKITLLLGSFRHFSANERHLLSLLISSVSRLHISSAAG